MDLHGSIPGMKIYNMPEEFFFQDQASLFSALLNESKNILATALAKRGRATMLVSGGSTPKLLYQQLSEEGLGWSDIEVALVDERWVESNHPASNQAFINQQLLQNQATCARFTAMKTNDEAAVDGLEECEKQYQSLPKPFDMTVLGMGSDGHTASLFPSAQGLADAMNDKNDKLCAAIRALPSDVTGEWTERMTLSLYGLMQSRQLHLLMTGQQKLDVYQQALVNDDFNLMPISAVLKQSIVPVNVYWAP